MAVLPSVGLIRPRVVDEVLAVIDDDHVPYAGATELVPAMRLGVRRPRAIVDLKVLGELRGIEVVAGAGKLRIGATSTHREVAADRLVRNHVPTLAAAASRVGNARVRTSGTIGGNLCFAEPRSDLSTVLTALGASATIASKHHNSVVPIGSFVVGAFETCLDADQLMVDVVVPYEPPGMTYWKLHSYERPTLGVATVPTIDGWRIVVGAATERPISIEVAVGHLHEVDSFVAGLELSDDLAGPAEYKRAVLLAYLHERLRGAA